MPSRITPLDVKAFAEHEIYRKGEQIYESQLVKHRFQTNVGLQATVRSNGNYHVEMIVDGEQLFGRCTCPAGSAPCEHQVATLLSWVNDSHTFISYQSLRKAIRAKDKNTLIDVLMNLIEVLPEISQFFIDEPGIDQIKAVREDVADIFDLPLSQKIDPNDILKPCQILLVRARLLRSEGKWTLARTILFEILNRTFALVEREQLSRPFRENFIVELADDYEEFALHDPDFDKHRDDIKRQVIEILEHDATDIEGIFFDQIKDRLKL